MNKQPHLSIFLTSALEPVFFPESSSLAEQSQSLKQVIQLIVITIGQSPFEAQYLSYLKNLSQISWSTIFKTTSSYMKTSTGFKEINQHFTA